MEQSHVGDSVVVGIGSNVIADNDHFAETVIDFQEWFEFLLFFLVRVQSVGRLNVVAVDAVGGNKIHFVLRLNLLGIDQLTTFFLLFIRKKVQICSKFRKVQV